MDEFYRFLLKKSAQAYVHQGWAIDAIGEWLSDNLSSRQEKRLLRAGVGTSMHCSLLLHY